MNKFNTSYFKIKESKLIEFLEAQIEDSGLDKHHLDIIKSKRKEIIIKPDGDDISRGMITVISKKMRAKIPLIIKDGKVIEYMSVYTFKERVKYWINNRFFTGYFRIPSNKDIHINNVWKDLK